LSRASTVFRRSAGAGGQSAACVGRAARPRGQRERTTGGAAEERGDSGRRHESHGAHGRCAADGPGLAAVPDAGDGGEDSRVAPALAASTAAKTTCSAPAENAVQMLCKPLTPPSD